MHTPTKPKTAPAWARTGSLAAGVLLILAAGCATAPKKTSHVFFPAPPDEPRVQFLMSFSSGFELGKGGGFQDFILGHDRASRPVVKPYGVTLAKDRIYICDTQIGSVDIVDLAKRRMEYFRPPGQGALGVPINIAVDADGTRYITDTKRNQVVMFSADEEYLGAIGTAGEMKPAGIVLSKDRIYVTDLKNHQLRVYAKTDRKLLFTIPRDPADPKARLFSPTNLAVDQQGQLYVSDTGDFSVKVFDAEGAYLRTIGQEGLAPGQFAMCKGVAVDRAGRIYVVDAKTQVVQLFDAQGRILMHFGDPTFTGGGATALPAGVAVDYENVKHFQQYAAPGFKIEYLIVLANQVGNQKISVFGFGQKH